MICGLPYPPLNESIIRLKREYIDRSGNITISGQQWYTTQAWRAVNQAVGRVIRHRSDYGAILLCDERFEREASTWLSMWLRQYVEPVRTFDGACTRLIQFFDGVTHHTIPSTVVIDDIDRTRYSTMLTIYLRYDSVTTEIHDSQIFTRSLLFIRNFE